MKHLPNTLSVMRMIAAFVLPILSPLSVSFTIVYVFGMISDVLDGFLARSLHLQSDAGARLDSTADFLFTLSAMVSMLAAHQLPSWAMPVACAVSAIRILSLVTGYLKFHAFASIHTFLNKAAGITLSLTPLICQSAVCNALLIPAAVLACLSSVEELLILLTTHTLDLNRTGFFSLPKS